MFFVLHTPVTSAPSDLAICTANVPTPPEAPIDQTFWPDCIRPWSRTAWIGVRPAKGQAAACSKVRPVGFSTKLLGLALNNSAKAPLGPSEDLVTQVQPIDIRADSLDNPCDVPSQGRPSWFAEYEAQG
jgi:hypothetical protein